MEHARPHELRLSTKTALILFSVTVLYVLYHYQGNAAFFIRYIAENRLTSSVQARSVYYQYGMAFILLGLAPLSIILFGFRESLDEYGLLMKKPLTALLVTVAGIAVVTPLVIYGARKPELAAIYPRIDNLSSSPMLFVQGSFFYLLYYIGYEICFRGFLFMGIRNDVGDVQALLVSLAVTVMLHLTQPQSETLMAVLAGFAFPLVVLRLKNIWPAVLIHAFVGISLNYWIIQYGGGFIR